MGAIKARMYGCVSSARLAAVLEFVTAGNGTISGIAKASGFSTASVTHAVHELRQQGLIAGPFKCKNPSRLGGNPRHCYVAAQDEAAAARLRAQVAEEAARKSSRQPSKQNGARTVWKKPKPRRHAGSGVIAPPCTIGRGFRWGAELL